MDMNKKEENIPNQVDLSPFDIPGPTYVEGFEVVQDLIKELSEKFDIDEEEIYIGRSSTPPSDPSCLAYVSLAKGPGFTLYFRKKLRSDGRWVCESFLHHVNRQGFQKGTYDYRHGIAYI